jgi:hypothetical protein
VEEGGRKERVMSMARPEGRKKRPSRSKAKKKAKKKAVKKKGKKKVAKKAAKRRKRKVDPFVEWIFRFRGASDREIPVPRKPHDILSQIIKVQAMLGKEGSKFHRFYYWRNRSLRWVAEDMGISFKEAKKLREEVDEKVKLFMNAFYTGNKPEIEKPAPKIRKPVYKKPGKGRLR